MSAKNIRSTIKPSRCSKKMIVRLKGESCNFLMNIFLTLQPFLQRAESTVLRHCK